MLTLADIINTRTQSRKKTDDSELRQLPYEHAFIYGRLSSPEQVRDSQESVREIARLVDLAKKDGYKTNLNSQEIETKLISLYKTPSGETVWSDNEVAVDVRDLGISGQLSFENRRGLSELQRLVRDGIVGAVYLTEGVSRLSRDKDRIIPYQLLKLLKEHQCRIRTPEGVWNPAIEKDWDYLSEEFEEAIGELRRMNRRLYRRKVQKAGRGEYVGEPIPPGLYLPVIGRKPSGEYEYRKMEPYPPHAEIVVRIFQEYIRQVGSCLKTCRALNNMTFPFFPLEMQYMERLTSLRTCSRTPDGYEITANLIRRLVTNLKMIGVFQWGDNEAIVDNHKPVVPRELFLEAYHLATRTKKPKGRAINFEPLEWSGLLHCMNDPEPRKIISLNSKERYVCNRDYIARGKSVCLDITARFFDEPLTTTVLRQLYLTPFTEEILDRMESENTRPRLEEIQNRKQGKKLEEEIKKWQLLLPGCVDSATDRVDREKEEFYWRQIREAQQQLEEIRTRPVPKEIPDIDYDKVREFLKGLTKNWNTYSRSLRNRFLKLIIEKVEIRGSEDIEARIIWKTGFQQKVIIDRPKSNSKLERRWTKEEDELLRLMYPGSSLGVVTAALPGRGWKGITLRAQRLKLSRKVSGSSQWRHWTQEDDRRLEVYYEEGMKLQEITDKLGRSELSVTTRIRDKSLKRLLQVRRG